MYLKAEAETSLPLTESTFLILLCLAPGPRHGYAIMKDVAYLSEGRVRLSTGTLYGALKRLLAQGWIQREDAEGGPDIEETGRPRKVYDLTDLGRRAVDAEAGRLRSLVAAAEGRTSEAPA